MMKSSNGNHQNLIIVFCVLLFLITTSFYYITSNKKSTKQEIPTQFPNTHNIPKPIIPKSDSQPNTERNDDLYEWIDPPEILSEKKELRLSSYELSLEKEVKDVDLREWEIDNLLLYRFQKTPTTEPLLSRLPEGWQKSSPSSTLSPFFQLVELKGKDSKKLLAIRGEGNGRKDSLGFISSDIIFPAKKWFQLRVLFKISNIEDVNRHLVHALLWKGGNVVIEKYKKKENGYIVGETEPFQGPQEEGKGNLRFYFRYSPSGQVLWYKISIKEVDPPKPRIVKIACGWGGGNFSFWSDWLDMAGWKGADVALIPEFWNGKGARDAEDLQMGESFNLMREKASQWNMYVTSSIYERRGDNVYNTAAVYDRRGNLLGTYQKNQLYDPEIDHVTPGIGYQVFQFDFAKVGIITCYDSWFPEPWRLLAYRGAELILFPSISYYLELMHARAADNGVFIATASAGTPSGVFDTAGTYWAEPSPSPYRRSPTGGIVEWEMTYNEQFILTTIDMSKKYSPHWNEGTFRSAPGSRRVRQTSIEPIEELVAKEARIWWTEEPDF